MTGERLLKPRTLLQLSPPRVPPALAVLLGTWLLLALQGCAGKHAQPVTLPTALPGNEPAADAAAVVDDESQEVTEVAAALDREEGDEADEAEEADEAAPAPEEVVTASPLDELGEFEPETQGDSHARDLVGPEPPAFDIPIVVNVPVQAWIGRYTRTHRGACEAALKRSGQYLDMFRKIFAEEGLPQDLVYMAHVESGYKTSAYSRAHARGVFQFIAGTARRYGLRVDAWADERSDPERSARAAARYMRDLYAEFGDWNLCFAAYNAGEGKIRRAIARSGTRDFWTIARTRHIRLETKNHIPAIQAAALISKSPGQYGFSVVPDPPIEYDTIEVEGAADLGVLARCAGVEIDEMKRLNPALRRGQTPPTGTFDVRVPAGRGEETLEALAAIPQSERVLYARHPVRRGETLSTIARRYGVGVSLIQQANHLGRSTLIHVNQTLLIPTSSASRAAIRAPERAVAAVQAPEGEPLTYRVRRGDTLSAIAERYDTTPASIAAASGISVRRTLRVGQRLTVLPGVRVAAAQSTRPAQSAGGTDKLVHTVRRGDTLWRIASLYRTTVNVLCSLNDIAPNATLHPGLKLTVGYR